MLAFNLRDHGFVAGWGQVDREHVTGQRRWGTQGSNACTWEASRVAYAPD